MNNIFSFLIGVAILLGIFLLCRAAVLWYWKVDEIVKLLKEIANNLKRGSEEK